MSISNSAYIPLLLLLIVLSLNACVNEPDPEPIPEVDPCEINPGTTLSFGEYIYEYDELGWPISISTNDTVDRDLGSSYRIYRYKAGMMSFTELQVDNGTYWSWDSLQCENGNCNHLFEHADTNCASSGCSQDMTLNIGNWVLTDGSNTYHYNDLNVLDSITYANKVFHFAYFQGRISRIYELNYNGDTLATQVFTFNNEGEWREYERNDYVLNQTTRIEYIYDTDGKINMVSIGYGVPPITISDYPVTQTGCGELPRSLDPLNLYRLPHMHFHYIGMPW